MSEQEQRLKIAIQKSGRLTDSSMDLLRSCGLNFEFQGRRLRTSVSNFPLDIILLKDDDILTYVKSKDADLGIVGEDLVVEYRPQVNIFARLGFGRCRLTLGIPKERGIENLSQLSDGYIATAYPRYTKSFFSELGIKVKTKKQNGSVEVAPSSRRQVIAITDITENGDTMRDNGIEPIQTIGEFEAVLVGNPRSYNQQGSRRIIDQLLFRVNKVVKIGENI